MANASEAQVVGMLQRGVGLYAAAYIRGVQTTDSIAALTEAATESTFGERASSVARGAEVYRGAYVPLLRRELIGEVLGPVLRAELDRIGSSSASIADSLLPDGDLHRNFVANNRTLPRRSITRGAASAGGSNVGDGWFYRLTSDYRGNLIQADPRPVGYEARCVSSSSSTGVGRETWFVEADTEIGKDVLTDKRYFTSRLQIQTKRSTDNSLLVNQSFDSTGSSTNKVPNWTDTSGAAITASTVSLVSGDGTAGGTGTDSIAAFEGATAPKYLRYTTGTAVEIQQTRRMDVAGPHVVGVWLRKVGTPTGTATIKLGTRTAAIAYSSITTSWAFYVLDSQDWWPQRWVRSGDGLGVTAALSLTDPGGTDEIHADSFTIVPMDLINQTYLAIGAGGTPWQVDDTVEYDDTETVPPNSTQHALALAYSRYLPSAVTSSTVTASGGRTLTFAASGDTITASTGDFTSDDFEVGQTLTVAGTSSNDGTYIITAVTATVITVASGITDEGPLSSTATLDGGPSIADPTVS